MDHGHQFRSENAIQNRGPEEVWLSQDQCARIHRQPG